MVQKSGTLTSWYGSLYPIVYKVFIYPSQVVFSPDFWTINSMGFFPENVNTHSTISRQLQGSRSIDPDW